MTTDYDSSFMVRLGLAIKSTNSGRASGGRYSIESAFIGAHAVLETAMRHPEWGQAALAQMHASQRAHYNEADFAMMALALETDAMVAHLLSVAAIRQTEVAR